MRCHFLSAEIGILTTLHRLYIDSIQKKANRLLVMVVSPVKKARGAAHAEKRHGYVPYRKVKGWSVFEK